jgi:hypothetical protein
MIFEFHSAWNSQYWIFIRRETVIEIVIQHGTQKPKFDFRFSGKNTREIVMAEGNLGQQRAVSLLQ